MQKLKKNRSHFNFIYDVVNHLKGQSEWSPTVSILRGSRIDSFSATVDDIVKKKILQKTFS